MGVGDYNQSTSIRVLVVGKSEAEQGKRCWLQGLGELLEWLGKDSLRKERNWKEMSNQKNFPGKGNSKCKGPETGRTEWVRCTKTV